jgi:hypothetical protein
VTPSAEPACRRPLRRLAVPVALVAVALAAFGAALAGSAPDKPYSAFISAPPSASATSAQATTSVGGAATVGIRLRNDTRTQRLGSANITPPAGLVVQAGSVTLVAPAGGTATLAGGVVKLRNLELKPGASAFVTFRVAVPCTAAAASYAFGIQVKQSNDFNGTGNDLNPANAPPRLSGIGACVPCPPGQQCTASTTSTASTATVSGTGTATGDRIRVSLAAPDAAVVNCPGYAETTETVEFDLTTAAGGSTGGLKTVTLLVRNPSKPASQYKVCFQADDGAPAAILPRCEFRTSHKGGSSTPRNAPCALAPESRSGKVLLTAVAPAGDPWIKG